MSLPGSCSLSGSPAERGERRINPTAWLRKVNLDAQALRRLLAGIKAALLAYLGKEDARFYPAIEKAAATDMRLEAILRLFREDLGALANEVRDFYALVDSITPADLLTAFGALATRIRSRIAKEESFLYPEYTRLGLS
jgi:hypothetical protein